MIIKSGAATFLPQSSRAQDLTSQIRPASWTGYGKLSLGLNECVNVCVCVCKAAKRYTGVPAHPEVRDRFLMMKEGMKY